MSRAEKLSREIRAWGQRSRGSWRFSEKLAEATDKAVAAVRKLRRSQERVLELLLSVTSHRPPDATLH